MPGSPSTIEPPAEIRARPRQFAARLRNAVAGAGILALALLFAVHGQRLIAGFRASL